MQRIIGVLVIPIWMAGVSACGIDPAVDRTGNAMQGDNQSSQISGSTAEADLSLASSTQDLIEPRAGCSVVQFCDVPNSADGTRCLQQGCSIATAERECISETTTVCGGHKCPWIFVTLSGTRIDLCSSQSCVARNACGGSTSSCFCDSACTSFGDCCPDGPC